MSPGTGIAEPPWSDRDRPEAGAGQGITRIGVGPQSVGSTRTLRCQARGVGGRRYRPWTCMPTKRGCGPTRLPRPSSNGRAGTGRRERAAGGEGKSGHGRAAAAVRGRLPHLRGHRQDPGGRRRPPRGRRPAGPGRLLRAAVVVVGLAVLAGGAALGLVQTGVIGNGSSAPAPAPAPAPGRVARRRHTTPRSAPPGPPS